MADATFRIIDRDGVNYGIKLVDNGDGTYSLDTNILTGSAVVSNPANVTATETTGTITVGATSQQVLAGNTARKYLTIYNDDTVEVLRYKFGAAATAASSGIAAGATLLLDSVVPTGTLNLIATTIAHKFAVVEG